ncbi:dihydrofolate reductase family protein [Isoptericola halotolerans]|uniref:Dihydrofolate reductase n=1 Tax=Isoptericola halotolerans TaxID=300560 RepID=A0ABX2A7R6_9MICO|nr:dihydrofolate reductase family protein [Isoptericola halotolerans]NOV97955.1 dihydrofolate reductase [Isoptericola halotolerans]
MGTVRFGMISCSLDGYVNDRDGEIGWTAPSDDRHAFINQRVGDVSVFVMGREMYEMLRVWDDWPPGREVEDEFAALWARTEKIVCSDTLGPVGAPRTTVEPRLTLDRLDRIVAETDGVVEVSGPTTAADALRSGRVDEIDVFVLPRVVGAGRRALPDGMEAMLELKESRAFSDGAVYLSYGRPRA